MRNNLVKKISVRNWCFPLVCLFFLSFSEVAKSRESDVGEYVRSQGWKTVCLGHFLIDLPLSAELGATKAEYDKPYIFPGINTGNAWGNLYYGDIKIHETMQTDKAGFDKIHGSGKAQMTSPEAFKKLIVAQKNDIAYLSDRMAKNPQDAAGYEGELQDRKNILTGMVSSSQTTGEAKIDDPNGFAIRLGEKYILGFFDALDKRVRIFQSEKMTSKNGGVQGGADEYWSTRKRYHTRLPTDIPKGPGFCTYYGFIDEPARPEVNVKMRVPIQIKQYPNLILALEIEPANPSGPPNIQKFPGMDTAHNVLDKIGVKRTHGPKAVQILGTPGRSYAQEYGDNCSSTSCRPASQAYDMEARTFGDPDRLDRPRLMLHMTAALADDYKLKLPAVPKGNNVPDRPALSGHVPPSYEVGREIFEQVLRSIRPRPGGIVAQGGPAASSAVPQK